MIIITHLRLRMINGRTTGLAAERTERIRSILRDRGIVSVEELCGELDASPATIRRDLLSLHRLGQVRRVHGGAIRVEGRLDEPVFEDKAALSADEKQRIAAAAAKLIQPTDSIFLDGGSTVLALAPLLVNMTRLTVVTNSLRVALALSGGGPTMFLVGGEFRRLSQTVVGPLTKATVDMLRVDKAFIGTIGVSEAAGLTTTDPREAFTKELVMAHAGEVVLLADSTKLGKVSFVKFGALKDVDIVITDRKAGAEQKARMRKAGVKLVVV